MENPIDIKGDLAYRVHILALSAHVSKGAKNPAMLCFKLVIVLYTIT